MTPKQFIEERLASLTRGSHAKPTGDIVDEIYTAMMSKKFRKYSNNETQKKNIRKAISMNVEANKPIRMGLPFGAYKLWRFEETPEVDWAELFTLIHFLRWLKPVTDIYEPGIDFEFMSDAVVIERMNNIPKKDTDRYKETLEGLFEFLKPHMPSNFKYSLFETSSLYTPEEFNAELNKHMEDMLEKNGGKYPEISDEAKRMVELNVKPKPGQTDDPLWREKVELMHQAFYMIERRAKYYKSPDRVATFPTPLENWACISVGTTKTSIAKFWPGVGALIRRGDDFIETVLSPSQLEKAASEWVKVDMDGLKGKNFKKIRVLD